MPNDCFVARGLEELIGKKKVFTGKQNHFFNSKGISKETGEVVK